MGLKYTKTGDYELPNLTLKDNKKGNINKYGMLRLNYLKQHKKALYTTLLMKDERAIGTKCEYLKLQNTTLKKYIPIENDKDNAT